MDLLLYGRLTPREALIAVLSALVPIKGLKQFKPFVDWLCVAELVEGTSVIERSLPSVSPISMDISFPACLVRIVKWDLPNWGSQGRRRSTAVMLPHPNQFSS